MEVFVGIDVGKEALVVAARTPAGPLGELALTVANSDTGLAGLVPQLAAAKPTLVVLEATGGYERLAAATLTLAGLPVVVVNPRQVRDFGKALGVLAKTDALDAAVLAQFAERIRPALRERPAGETALLSEQVLRRRQVVDMITAETNRRALLGPAVRERVDAHIGWLKRELDDIEHDLQRLIEATPAWRARDELLQSTPGVGPRVSHSLMALLPELGRLSRQRVASLVGVAPFADDSGRHAGVRHIKGGRASVRAALYMAVLTGIRHNPILKAFYARLRGKGKAAKVALTACMRKLLTILNTMVRTNQPWHVDATRPVA